MIERQRGSRNSDTKTLEMKDSETEKYRDGGDPKLVRDKDGGTH